jgi:IPT/TIG domain-containing protein/List-Bact-rpt repeat protein
VNLVERALRQPDLRRFLTCLALASLLPAVAVAEPIASSNFAGVENPLVENGAWQPMFSMAPDHTQFQKNNGAFIDRFDGRHNNHAVARTTAAVPNDHYSEVVVGHIGNEFSYVGATVRVQTSGPAIDSLYMYWGSFANGQNNFLYRIVADGIGYSAASLVPHSAFADGDRIRLIARGPVLYGIKNGVREFIYNTGRDATRYDTGTTGILAYVPGPPETNGTIASWSTGAAPASAGTWASSNFAGVEDPLDEGDRWFPLPGYSGFRKAGGVVIGKNAGHNISGAWGIAPPQKQYSEVTLGTVASGSGGGPIVRIDRNSPDKTGWLLFLWVDNPSSSGIYKVGKDNPQDGGFTPVRFFTPAAILPGDKWRLTADGNTLEVFRNGVSQFTFTTDGSYPTGDVGIETLSPAFTLVGWEGGDANGPALPTIASFTPTSGPVGTSVTINGTNFTGATAVAFNGVSATFTVTSATAIQATVPAGATTGPLTVTTPSGTATSASSFTVLTVPAIASFSPTSGPVGTSVTINGSNFTGATAVAFNGVSATFSVTSDSAIQTAVPAGATSGPVSVTTPGGTATSSSSFTVLSPPAIASFAPTSGPVGTSVTISGTKFTGASAVAFNGVGATFTVSSDTSIQATVPAGATTGTLTVTTPGGTATSGNSFTVVSPPAIASFAPTSGPVGTTVTISGTKFTGASAVAFNGVGATFTLSSDTSIQATVPAGATTGPLSVTTPGGTATSGSSFTVVSPPAIASFSPTSGPVGTAVTISGTSFTGATAVAFNGVGATFTVTSDAAIQAIVPVGARTGPVSVTTPGGTATSAGNFVVTAILTAAKAGTGNGSLTSSSSPASATQINCGATCSASYGVGTVVTLTATAAAGSVQTGWTGCDTASGATCTVTMNAARTVTATFAVQTFTLSVRKSSLLLGNGTVTSSSSPASSSQINCGSTCSASYVSGTVVTLRAAPAFLSSFSGWSGCDTVSGTTCTVAMNRARSVTANFLP